MMKPTTILLLFLLLAPPLTLGADQRSGTDYQPLQDYPGLYKKEILYQFDDFHQTWYASSSYKTWKGLSCWQARRDLGSEGTWSGNLTPAGDCAGEGEEPTWATGNYLNYLQFLDQDKEN